MKYLLLISLLIFSFFIAYPVSVHAQPLPSLFFCVGDNPRPPCATIAPTQPTTISNSPSAPITCAPPPQCFKNRVLRCMIPAGGWCQVSPGPTVFGTNPSPSAAPSQSQNPSPANPSPSTSPCATSRSSVREQSNNNSNGLNQLLRRRPPMPRGLLQQLLQLLLQLLQLLFQQLGIQFPIPPSNPCPQPSPAVSPATSPATSVAPSSSASPSASLPTSTIPSGSPVVSQPASTSAIPGQTGLLESDIAAGTSTNKLCLDDKGNGNANNNPVITWACNSADKAQQWTQYSDNSIRINGKCLDVNKNGTADRTPVDLFTCNGGQNQQWALIPIASTTAPNRTELKGIQSNKCLDIKGSSTANGTQLEIFTCNGGANQGWAWNFGTLPPATGGGGATVTHSGSIQSNLTAAGSKTPLCVDDTNNSSTNGNPVQTWTCNNGNAQRWTGYSDNTIKINGKCLEVAGQGTGNGAKVDIYTCNGGKNQQWKQNGKELQDVQAPTMCLDITGQSTKNGTKLEIYKCNGGNNQAWTWNGSGSTTGGGGNNGGGGGNTNWAYAAPTGASYTHTKGSTKITLKWSAVTKDTSGKTETAPSGYTVAFYDNSGKLLDQSTTGSTNPTFTETNIKMNTLVHLNIWANGGPKSPANTRVPGSGNITW